MLTRLGVWALINRTSALKKIINKTCHTAVSHLLCLILFVRAILGPTRTAKKQQMGIVTLFLSLSIFLCKVIALYWQ